MQGLFRPEGDRRPGSGGGTRRAIRFPGAQWSRQDHFHSHPDHTHQTHIRAGSDQRHRCGQRSSRRKSEFGIVKQHQSLNRDLTIAENLELHARLHHLSRAERKKRISELLDYVELTDHADYLVDDVSGGMKRRAMIARALIHRPKLLFLDEPTVGLDAHTGRRVWDLIRRMNSED